MTPPNPTLQIKSEFIERYADAFRLSLSDAEEDVWGSIEQVASQMSKLIFGFYEEGDFAQESRILSLEVINSDRYDFQRSLAAFLYTHSRNRIQNNFTRRQFFRNEKPCECCDRYNPPKTPCSKWIAWSTNNARRQKVLTPASLASDAPITSPYPPMSHEIDYHELNDYITARLPAEYHEDFVRFAEESPMTPARREAIRWRLYLILEDSPYAAV